MCDAPNRGAGHHHCQRDTAATIEPAGDDASVNHSRCSGHSETNDRERGVQMPEMRGQQCKRCEGSSARQQADGADLCRADAIDNAAHERCGEGCAQRHPAEGARDRFAGPRELLVQRFQKHREGGDRERRNKDRDAGTRGHGPAFIAKCLFAIERRRQKATSCHVTLKVLKSDPRRVVAPVL
jgi:hypothetical protein